MGGAIYCLGYHTGNFITELLYKGNDFGRYWIGKFCVMRFLLIVVFSFSNFLVFGQKSKKEKSFLTDNQKWTLELPIWIPGFRGSLSYGSITIDGEDGSVPELPPTPTNPIEPGNIFSRLFSTNTELRFFFVGRATFQSKKFIFIAEDMGGSIGKSLQFNYNNTELVQLSINGNIGRIFIGYELLEKRTNNNKMRMQLYGYAGSRLYIFKFHSTLNDPVNNLNLNPIWLDPLIGLQFQLDMKNWQFIISNDLGNFYISDRFSYSTQILVYYRISKLISIRTGWTDLDVRHKSIVLGEELKWTTHLSGPSLGIAFHF